MQSRKTPRLCRALDLSFDLRLRYCSKYPTSARMVMAMDSPFGAHDRRDALMELGYPAKPIRTAKEVAK